MENESFKFTYSAKEQEELRKIREKYEPQSESKMDMLRRLDAKVTQKATGVSIMLGVFGSLILGMGMSLAMTDIGEKLGLMGTWCMAAGICVGLAGIVLVSIAYPVYHRILKKERKKIAPQILRLTEELMK